MDYIDHVDVTRHASFDAFRRRSASGRLDPADDQGRASPYDFMFEPDDILLFGKESAGVPADVAAASERRCGFRIRLRGAFLQSRHFRRDRPRRGAAPDRRTARMTPLDDQQQAARDWFESLRDRICAAFEAIEREAGSDARFDYIPWDRTEEDGTPGGGGVRGQMNGKVFEKVGVNVSTVGGRFSPEFAASIPGAEEDPSFFATGISLVAHMANPHVPAVHMNTRFLTTTRRWFGGGADLNPAIPYEEDTDAFHARLRAACAAHDPTFYPRFSKWAEEYFWLPHRKRRARRRRHFLRPAGRSFRRAFRLHPRRRRSVPRHFPEDRPPADGHAVHRCGHRACSNSAAATSSSTCSTTAAHCSGSRPAAISTPS